MTLEHNFGVADLKEAEARHRRDVTRDEAVGRVLIHEPLKKLFKQHKEAEVNKRLVALEETTQRLNRWVRAFGMACLVLLVLVVVLIASSGHRIRKIRKSFLNDSSTALHPPANNCEAYERSIDAHKAQASLQMMRESMLEEEVAELKARLRSASKQQHPASNCEAYERTIDAHKAQASLLMMRESMLEEEVAELKAQLRSASKQYTRRSCQYSR